MACFEGKQHHFELDSLSDGQLVKRTCDSDSIIRSASIVNE